MMRRSASHRRGRDCTARRFGRAVPNGPRIPLDTSHVRCPHTQLLIALNELRTADLRTPTPADAHYVGATFPKGFQFGRRHRASVPRTRSSAARWAEPGSGGGCGDDIDVSPIYRRMCRSVPATPTYWVNPQPRKTVMAFPMNGPRPDDFVIDDELIRDAISAGIWNRLCPEIRGHKEGHGVDQYIQTHASGRGNPAKVLGYLDADIGLLADTQRQLKIVRNAPVGSPVELDDVERFVPISWIDDDPEAPGRWIYTESETEEAELLVPDAVMRVRTHGEPGTDARSARQD